MYPNMKISSFLAFSLLFCSAAVYGAAVPILSREAAAEEYRGGLRVRGISPLSKVTSARIHILTFLPEVNKCDSVDKLVQHLKEGDATFFCQQHLKLKAVTKTVYATRTMYNLSTVHVTQTGAVMKISPLPVYASLL